MARRERLQSPLQRWDIIGMNKLCQPLPGDGTWGTAEMDVPCRIDADQSPGQIQHASYFGGMCKELSGGSLPRRQYGECGEYHDQE
jgi:hypothetical protein